MSEIPSTYKNGIDIQRILTARAGNRNSGYSTRVAFRAIGFLMSGARRVVWLTAKPSRHLSSQAQNTLLEVAFSLGFAPKSNRLGSVEVAGGEVVFFGEFERDLFDPDDVLLDDWSAIETRTADQILGRRQRKSKDQHPAT